MRLEPSIEDLPENDREGARIYRGHIYRIVQCGRNFYIIEEYRRNIKRLFLKKSWVQYFSFDEYASSSWFSVDGAQKGYEKLIDYKYKKRDRKIIIPLTKEEEDIKDVVE